MRKQTKPRVAVGNLTIAAALQKDRTNAETVLVLQHRHYAVIAGIIKRLDLSGYEANSETIRADIARQFANTLARNPRFDRERFLRASCLD